jgi:hypothetical protein
VDWRGVSQPEIRRLEHIDEGQQLLEGAEED